jgi:hypothetical protein
LRARAGIIARITDPYCQIDPRGDRIDRLVIEVDLHMQIGMLLSEALNETGKDRRDQYRGCGNTQGARKAKSFFPDIRNTFPKRFSKRSGMDQEFRA